MSSSDTNPPNDGDQDATTARQAPSGGYQAPSSGYQAPGNQSPINQAPGNQAPGNSEPVGADQSTPSGYQPPGGGYQAPGGSYQAPGGSYQAPGGGYQTPGGGFQPSGGSYQAPGGGYQAPGGSFPPAPGYSTAPGGYAPAPGAGYQTKPPSNGSRKRVWIIVGAVIVGLIVISGVIAFFNRHDPADAKVGDCLKGSNGSNAETVNCSSSDALYKVVEMTHGKRDDVQTLCAASGATKIYWQGKSGQSGTVLCLVPAK